MDSARWSRVRDLKSKVRGLPPDHAHDALERDCAGDSTLVYLVENLLHYEVATSQFLAEVHAGFPDRDPDRPVPSRTGTRAGPFVVAECIGMGGQSEVYAAERPEYGQVVALKFIPADLLSSQAVAVLEDEARTLAQMKHDNIADFHGVEKTDDGTPVLVIELVDGQPLDIFLTGKTCRSPQERLTMFQKICSAIESAHAKGIIHGDIKPRNVVVTEKQEPRLVDFGIAQRVGVSPGTVRGVTLGYSAPEQVTGQCIDERSDIYSLGVLLYELITGDSPFPTSMTVSRDHFSQAIAKFQPQPPSTRLKRATAAEYPPASTQALSRSLMLDLDCIVLRALATDPNHRYQTVGALSDDLDRFVKLRPVLARRGSKLYTMRKFLRRNRAFAATAASIVALSLLGFIWFGTVRQGLALRAARAGERAGDAQYEQKLFSDALATYQRALDEISPDRVSPGRSKEDIPRILVKIGRSHLALAPAVPDDEIEARRSIQAYQRALVALHTLPETPLLVEAHLGFGKALLILAETRDKEASLQQALASLRIAAALTRNRDRERYGLALVGLADAHRGLAQVRDPGPNLERALAEATEASLLLDATHHHAGFLNAQHSIGLTETALALQAGKPTEHFQKALIAFNRAISEAHPDVDGTALAHALASRANLYVRVGNLTFDDNAFSSAERDYVEALDLYDSSKNAKDYAETAHNLGGLYYARAEGAATKGNTSDRIAFLEKSRGPLEQAIKAFPFPQAPLIWGRHQFDLALVLADLGEVKQDTTLLTQAVEHGEAALHAFRQDDYPQDRARADFALGHTLILLGSMRKDNGTVNRAVKILSQPMPFLQRTHNLQRIGVFQNELARAWYTAWQITHRPADAANSLQAFDEATLAFKDYPQLAEVTRRNRAEVAREVQKAKSR